MEHIEQEQLRIKELEERLKEAEREIKEANDAKSEFLMRVNHEVRTPVNAITGMCYIAKNHKDINKIRDCLEKIDTSSKQLLEIISDMLDMSKLEEDNLSLVNCPFELEKHFIEICKMISVNLKDKSQSLSVKFSTELKAVYVGDSARLSQILMNLLSNAMKFSPIGSKIELNASLLEKTQSKTRILFSVIDEGIGVSPENIKKLFLPFSQADGGISRRYGGTGLGLAICKKLANLMGGDITVQSELNKGSNFSFHIFLDNAPERAKSEDDSDGVENIPKYVETGIKEGNEIIPNVTVKADRLPSADARSNRLEGNDEKTRDLLSELRLSNRYSGNWAEFMPFINVNVGLNRIMRNRKLYAKLLRNFLDLNGISRINIASSEKDLLVLADALHSLKGTAGNLGIDALYDFVKLMENDIKSNQDAFSKVTELNNLMSKTIEYIDKVLEELDKW